MLSISWAGHSTPLHHGSRRRCSPAILQSSQQEDPATSEERYKYTHLVLQVSILISINNSAQQPTTNLFNRLFSRFVTHFTRRNFKTLKSIKMQFTTIATFLSAAMAVTAMPAPGWPSSGGSTENTCAKGSAVSCCSTDSSGSDALGNVLGGSCVLSQLLGCEYIQQTHRTMKS